MLPNIHSNANNSNNSNVKLQNQKNVFDTKDLSNNLSFLSQSTKENLLLAVFALLNELDEESLMVVRKQVDKIVQFKRSKHR